MRESLKALSVCSPSAVRSTRNKMRRNRLVLSNRYTKAIQVLVLPVPVAIANSNTRCSLAKADSTAWMARI